MGLDTYEAETAAYYLIWDVFAIKSAEIHKFSSLFFTLSLYLAQPNILVTLPEPVIIAAGTSISTFAVVALL